MNLGCAINNSVIPMKLVTLDESQNLANKYCDKCYYYPCMLTTEVPCKLNKTTELNCLNNFGIDNNLYNISNCTNILYIYGLPYANIKVETKVDTPKLCKLYIAYNFRNNVENLPKINVTNTLTQTNTITPTNTVNVTENIMQSTPHFRFDNVTKTETATINTTKTFTETKTQNVTETQTQTNICPTSTKYIQENTKNIDNLVNKLSDLDFQKCLNNNQTIGLVETTEIATTTKQSFIDKIGLTYVIIGASLISTLLLFAIILGAKKCIQIRNS